MRVMGILVTILFNVASRTLFCDRRPGQAAVSLHQPVREVLAVLIPVVLTLFRTAAAIWISLGGALAFYPALGATRRVRLTAFLLCSSVTAICPAIIPLTERPLRFAAALVSVVGLVKLYDLNSCAGRAGQPDFESYAEYLPNVFWLVRRKAPPASCPSLDVRRLIINAPLSAVALAAAVLVFAQGWVAVPFIVEHSLKVLCIYAVVVPAMNAAAAACRLAGIRALVPMMNPAGAVTPGQFWRRWNRPAQQFLEEHAFKPAGGPRHFIRATLVTFAVSGLVHEYIFDFAAGRVLGWQLAFFGIQGLAVVVTRRVRPSAGSRPAWLAVTFAFNLLSSILFFRSVDAVVPFY
jgi:hypothetical protein